MELNLYIYVLLIALRGASGQPTGQSNVQHPICNTARQEELLNDILTEVKRGGSRRADKSLDGVFALRTIDHNEYLLDYINTANWYDARELCYKYGYRLAHFESALEHTSVKSWLKTVTKAKMIVCQGSRVVFIDGILLRNQSYWVYTAGAVDRLDEGYQGWADNQPDDHHGNEECLGMFSPFGYDWIDYQCDVRSRFLCRRRQGEVVEPLQSLSTALDRFE